MKFLVVFLLLTTSGFQGKIVHKRRHQPKRHVVHCVPYHGCYIQSPAAESKTLEKEVVPLPDMGREKFPSKDNQKLHIIDVQQHPVAVPAREVPKKKEEPPDFDVGNETEPQASILKLGRLPLTSFFFFPPTSGGNEDGFPVEVREEIQNKEGNLSPEDLKGAKWKRWTTENFVILSLDHKKGEYLYKNIEKIKSQMLNKWGFPDIKFPVECRVLCFSDKEIYNKALKIEKSYQVEVRQGSTGNIDLVVLFLLLDGNPVNDLPIPITEVSLVEFGIEYSFPFPFWAARGISQINQPVSVVREELGNLKGKKYISASVIFSSNSLDWFKMEKRARDEFDEQCAALCLFLRKEFGEIKLHSFINLIGSGTNVDKSIRLIYGFRDINSFNESYERFMRDLSSDITRSNPERPETPDDYLIVKSYLSQGGKNDNN